MADCIDSGSIHFVVVIAMYSALLITVSYDNSYDFKSMLMSFVDHTKPKSIDPQIQKLNLWKARKQKRSHIERVYEQWMHCEMRQIIRDRNIARYDF